MLFNVIAYHVGHKIVLREIKNKVNFALIKKEHSYLLYRLDDYSFIYLKDYGSVAFFNCTEKVKKDFFNTIFNEEIDLEQVPFEKYKIKVEEEQTLFIGFDQIELPRITVDIAHIIMLNLAQSVALDYYYIKSSELLESSAVYSKQLEDTGKIKLSRNKMRSYIGKTMNIKNKIAEELFIFDTSTLAWNTEELSELDKKINEELNIVERHYGLQHNLGIIKENLDLFKDILHHNHSSLLEWLIVILILFEIIQILIENA
jgi:uncharacterized Rmd1/YagE family protein